MSHASFKGATEGFTSLGGIKIPKISTFVGGIENTDIGRSVFEEYNFI